MKATVTLVISFLKTHILGTIIIGIFCSVAASFIYSWMQPTHTPEPFLTTPTDLHVQSVPLPEEIAAEIKSRPPLQRDETAAHYIGQRFRWRVTLLNAEESADGLIHLILLGYGGTTAVVCTVPRTAYTSLQTTKQGTEFYITGTITNANAEIISLTDVILK